MPGDPGDPGGLAISRNAMECSHHGREQHSMIFNYNNIY